MILPRRDDVQKIVLERYSCVCLSQNYNLGMFEELGCNKFI
jgi:hypothetical protein